jgi:DNA-directed RNA polymerase specialized sigma24 family protein
MTTAWEVVAAWEGRRREFMVPALLHAVRMRLDRRAQAWRREMGRRTEWAEVSDPEGPSESAPEQLARVLEDAADGILSRRDASVVYAHRVLGLTMVELAAMTGHSRQALDRCRARAEQRLCA